MPTVSVIATSYFEQDGENALVRPWVWIALIAIGPITYSITLEWYRYLSVSTVPDRIFHFSLCPSNI